MNGIIRTIGVLGGKPCVEGTRVPTRQVLSLFLAGRSMAYIAKDVYPSLTAEQVEQAIRFECCLACHCSECKWAVNLKVSP
jgi:uncharacterized protein (DUF433 family)